MQNEDFHGVRMAGEGEGKRLWMALIIMLSVWLLVCCVRGMKAMVAQGWPSNVDDGADGGDDDAHADDDGRMASGLRAEHVDDVECGGWCR